jgi:hypothetical protein
MLGNSSLAAQLAALQEGLSCMVEGMLTISVTWSSKAKAYSTKLTDAEF